MTHTRRTHDPPRVRQPVLIPNVNSDAMVGLCSARRTLRLFETKGDAAAADDNEAAPIEEKAIDAVEDVEDTVVRMEENNDSLPSCLILCTVPKGGANRAEGCRQQAET